MIHLLLAAFVLAVIIWTSLRVESLGIKVLIFFALGAGTAATLLATAGELGHEVLHHTFLVDYPQFIVIPLATVAIASLGLFAVKVRDGAKLGWFLWLIAPIIGNFGTTWAMVPVGLSLIPTLKQMYPKTWKEIAIATCVFSMNMLALGTLAADPPQALWAVKVSASGAPLGFFFPFSQFWVYILVTWGLYFIVLKRLGVSFGSISELGGISPKSWTKFATGVVLAVCVGFAITALSGYNISYFLGGLLVLAILTAFVLRRRSFSHEERHNTMHWLTETATIFVAFFSVVAFAHAGLQEVPVSNQAMIGPIIGMTLGADNAAAFAAAYPQFEALPAQYMTWYNLFNSVVYGGVSPLGNGPQITLFLIILVALREFKSGEVFKVWFKEALVFAPYLLIWTLVSTIVIEQGMEFSIPIQILTGIGSLVAANEFMDLQTKFRKHVDVGTTWDGRRPQLRVVHKDEDADVA
ncbi:MAG TPA: hypothetical protein DEP63_02195 [Candidatus Magasanikbacteria bacterium]|nr:hypothetical protein [Candidatus Magasanikbacteria bacterium]